MSHDPLPAEWQDSPDYRLFLAGFLSPQRLDDVTGGVDWAHALGQEPLSVVATFLAEGLLQYVNLTESFADIVQSLHDLTVAELKRELEHRGLPTDGRERKRDLITRLIRQDSSHMQDRILRTTLLQCTEEGRRRVEHFFRTRSDTVEESTALPTEQLRTVLKWIALAAIAGIIGDAAYDAVKALVSKLGVDRAPVRPSAPETRRAWSLLALFPAPFDLAAAAAVWDCGQPTALDQLQTLCDRGLLTYDPETDRYSQHDLLRLAAAQDLPATQEVDAARERLAQHYLVVARAAKKTQRFLDLDPDWPHLRAALDHAVEREPDLLSDLVIALNDYWSARGMARQFAAWSRRAAEAAHAAGDRSGEARRLGDLGNAHLELGEVRTAIDYHERALAIAQEIGDRRREGSHLRKLGWDYANLGEAPTAIDYCKRALAIAREIGDRGMEGNALRVLGTAYKNLGEVRIAIDYHEQALSIAQDIGDRGGEGSTLANLGTAYKNLGDADRARELWTEALYIFDTIEHPGAERVRAWLADLEQ